MCRRIKIVLIFAFILLCAGIATTAFTADGKAELTKPRLIVQVGHSGEINNATYSKSRRLLATHSFDSIIIWDNLSGRELQHINTRARKVLISSDDHFLAWQTYFGDKYVVAVWDISQQALNIMFSNPVKELVAFSNDSKSVIVVTNEGDLLEWPIEKSGMQNSKVLTKGLCGDDCYSVLKYSEDKKLAAIHAARDRSVLYSFRTGQKTEYCVLTGKSTFRKTRLSQNGKFMVVANNNRIEVKSLTDDKLLHSLTFEGDGCSIMKISDDSNLLAAVSSKSGLKVWNLDSGREVFNTHTVNFCHNSVSFSPNGGSVAVARGKQINIFKLAAKDGGSPVSLSGHARDVQSVAFIRKEGLIASFDGKDLYLWDIRKQKILWRLACTTDDTIFEYPDLVASPEGRYLVIIERKVDNKKIKFIDLSSKKIIDIFDGSDFISFHPDGNKAFVCSPKGCSEIYIKNGKVEEHHRDSSPSIPSGFGTSFSYTKDGDVIANYLEYSPVSVHSLSGKLLSTFPGIINKHYSISDDFNHILPHDRVAIDQAINDKFKGYSLGVPNFLSMFSDDKIIVGYKEGLLDLLDFTSGKRLLSENFGSSTERMTVSPSGKRIAVLADGELKIVQVSESTLETMEPKGLKDAKVKACSFLSESEICFSNGRNLARYDLSKDVLLGQHYAVQDQIVSVAVSKNNAYMATYIDTNDDVLYRQDGNNIEGLKQTRVDIWDLKKMVKTKSLQVPFDSKSPYNNAMTFSLDGHRLAISDPSQKQILVYDLLSSSLLRTIQTNKKILCLTYGPANKWLATGNNENEIDIWRMSDGKKIRTYKGHINDINTIDISSEGELFSGSSDGTIKTWKPNQETFSYSWKVSPKRIDKIRLSRNGKKIIVVIPGDSLLILDARTGAELHRVPLGEKLGVSTFDLSPDERLLAYCTTDPISKDVRVVDLSGGNVIFTRNYVDDETADTNVLAVGFTSNSRLFIQTVTSSYAIDLADKDIRRTKQFAGYNTEISHLEAHGDLVIAEGNGIDIWNMKRNELFRGLSRHVKHDMRLSPDGKSVLSLSSDDKQRVELWNIITGEKTQIFSSPSHFWTTTFSKDSKMIAVGGMNGALKILDGKTLSPLSSMISTAGIHSLSFSNDNKFVISGETDQSITILSIATGQWLAKLYSFTDGTWAVVAPDGRFDTNNLEEIKGLHWVVPDDPLTPLPLEVFMKDYYEPRLLPRILNGDTFKPVRDLQSLNRVQPAVKVVSIQREGKGDTVAVTVEVAGQKLMIGNKETSTGIHDLKLFRDGQLVGFKEGKLNLDKNGKAVVTFSNIRLPRKAGIKDVEFSAYAFNDDGIKSLTSRSSFTMPTDITPTKGKAYLVNIGVNQYQNSDWNLQYAAGDATSIRASLKKGISKSGSYSETVPITLTDAQATKQNIQAIFDLLSGKTVSPDQKKQIPNADRLTKATPEDMLVISFSGHGHVDDNGIFYTFTHDTGAGTGKTVTPALLSHIISSDELSNWLRYVDAGEMAMIVDACHSAATVGDSFKPGPMGSRGLGQLAYDKGMRILAASQADDVALESDKLQHGLLTYSLVHDGLEAFQADFKPKDKSIQLSEWLAYGVDRVPKLYEEVKTGTLSTFGRGEASRTAIRLSGAKQNSSLAKKNPYQTPALFDFTRKAKTDSNVMVQ